MCHHQNHLVALGIICSRLHHVQFSNSLIVCGNHVKSDVKRYFYLYDERQQIVINPALIIYITQTFAKIKIPKVGLITACAWQPTYQSNLFILQTIHTGFNGFFIFCKWWSTLTLVTLMTQSNDTFIYCKIDRKREYWKMSFRHNCQVIYRFPLRNEMRRTEEANAYMTFRSKTIHRQEVSSYIFITLRRVSYPYLTWHICSSIVLGHITRLNVYIITGQQNVSQNEQTHESFWYFFPCMWTNHQGAA